MSILDGNFRGVYRFDTIRLFCLPIQLYYKMMLGYFSKKVKYLQILKRDPNLKHLIPYPSHVYIAYYGAV